MNKVLNKSVISSNINLDLGISKQDAANITDEFFNTLKKNVKKEGELKIPGFGNFNVKQKSSRPGRNPKTLEPHIIKSRKVVTFKISKLLKQKINEAN
jgi:integration host factor subunit alpha